MQPSAISLALLALCASASPAARAQDAVTLPKVQVTGSNIPRIESETSTPTLVISRKDIQAMGLSSLKEVLDSLTGASQLQTGSNRTVSDMTGALSYAAGGSAISLRHLGPQSTLVLLNFRRLSSFAMHDDPAMFTDLSTLPLDAVERIEVLRSGASAIYGSDAIAGVINIITRKNYRGAALRASQERSTNSSDFRTTTAGLTAGVGDWREDGFNLMLNAELYRRSAVSWADVLHLVDPESTKYGFGIGARSRWSNPGNINGVALAGCDPSQIQGTTCTYDKYQRLEAQPAADRGSLLLTGRLALRPGLEGFAEALYGRSKTMYVLPDPTYDVQTVITWFDPTTEQLKLFRGRGLPAGHPLNFTGQDNAPLTYRFTDADSHILVESVAYRALAGLRGTERGYDWQSALGVMGSTVHYGGRGLLSDSGFRTLIGDYAAGSSDPQFFNRGYRIGGGNSADVLNTLFPLYTQTGHMKQAFVDGRLSGPVGTWGGRPIEIALGFDLRHESLDESISDNLMAGDIIGAGMSQTQGSRTFGSIYTEANLPISDRLELQAASRVDKYQEFRANVSPKLGMRFEASPAVMVRGHVESGFRAPNLVENATTTLHAFDYPISDPKRCDQATQLAQDLTAQSENPALTDAARAALVTRALIVQSLECAGSMPAIRKSNPALQPEKALGKSLGLVFSPSERFLVEVDYWRIVRRNEIGFTSGQALVNAEDTLPAGTVNRLPLIGDRSFTPAEQMAYGVTAGALSSTTSQYENAAKTAAAGVDFGIRGRVPTEWGVVTTAVQASYLSDFYRYSTFRGGWGDNLAGRYGYPRWRANWTTGLDTGSFGHQLRLNFTSATNLQGDFYDVGWTHQACLDNGWTVGDCRVRRSFTLDYALAYTGVPGLTVSLNIRNLLNTRPPVDQRAFYELGGSSIPQNLADAYRRTVRLALEYKFL